MSLVDRMMSSRRLALSVKRYHTWPTIQQQTVADHTCQVMRVYVEIFGPPSQDVFLYMLWHDISEMHTGDIPFQAKRLYPALKKVVDEIDHSVRAVMDQDGAGGFVYRVSDEEVKLAKVCDLLEMWEFGRQEMSLGNKMAEPIVTRTAWAASALAEELGVTDKINRWMEVQL